MQAATAFDQVARLAARLCRTPTAVVHAITDDGPRVLAAVGDQGLATVDTATLVDVLVAAAGSRDVVRIADASLDPRLQDHPLVDRLGGLRYLAVAISRGPFNEPATVVLVADRTARTGTPDDLVDLRELVGIVACLPRRLPPLTMGRVAGLLDVTIDTAPVGIALVDAERRVLRCNRSFADLAGRVVDDLVGRDVTDLLDPNDRAQAAARAAALVDGGMAPGMVERRITRPDGSQITVAIRTAVARDPESVGVLAVNDVTAEHTARRLLDAVLDAAPVGIAIVDEHRRIVRCNATFALQLGRPTSTLIGTDPTDALARADREVVRQMWSGHQRTAAVPDLDVRIDRPDGTPMTVNLRVLVVDEPVRTVVAATIDITERDRLVRELAHQASHDPLTSLPNRVLFRDEVERALARARRDGHLVAVAYIDLDRFKVVNDNHGHSAGDRVLRDVASRLRSSIRAGDVAARLGGDEFAVLLDPVGGLDEARAIAERVRDDVRSVHPDVGASVGVALYRAGDTGESLIQRADSAQYVAKARRDSSVHTVDR